MTVTLVEEAGSTAVEDEPGRRRRLRVRFSKNGKIRFVGHRDVARCWERAIRRAELPMVYSEGFNPRPRLHFGLALSVGHESDAEYIDLDIVGDIDLDAAEAALSEGMPSGIEVTDLVEVSTRATALQAAVSSTTWRMEPADADAGELMAAVEELRAAEHRIIPVERKGRPVEIDVVEQVLSLDVDGGGAGSGPAALLVELSTEGRSVRPAEFLTSFTPPLEARRVRRLEQWVQREGRRLTPLECDAPSPSPT